MASLPVISGREAVKAFDKIGFIFHRQSEFAWNPASPHFSRRDYIESCKPRLYDHVDDSEHSAHGHSNRTGHLTPMAAIGLFTSRYPGSQA